MARFDGVFFDSGGTLYEVSPQGAPGDTWQRRGDRLYAALQQWGCDVDRQRVDEVREELEARLPRERAPQFNHLDLIQAIAEQLGLGLSIEELACVTDTYTGPRYRSWLFPGTHEMLQRLEDAGTYVGLIANTHWPGWTMDRAFMGVGLARYFRVRVYSGDLGIQKPDVGIFREAERCARFEPGPHLLYVGNSPPEDVEGARAAGWSTAFRCSPQHPDSGGRADLDFDQWEQLTRFILDE